MSDYETMMAKLQDMNAKVESGEVKSEVQVKSMDEALSGNVQAAKEEPAAAEVVEEVSSSESSPKASYSSAEDEAMLQGWVPKEQFKGNPKDYVDAQTFLDRGDFRLIEARKLRAELSDMSKKNEELTHLVKGLVDDIRDAEERGKQKKLRELAEQKKQARDANDLLVYEAIQEEEKKLVKSKEEPVNPHQPVIDAYNRACEKAPWFEKRNTDPVAAARWNEAEAEVQSKLLKANPKASYDDQFNFAIEYIAAKYPGWGDVKPATKEVDEEQEASRGSKTISGSTVSTKSYGSKDKGKKLQVKDLSPTRLDIYKRAEKNPDFGVSPSKLLEMWSEQDRG